MDTETKVLDHGYVKCIPRGCWGDDEIIIESARQSTDGAFRGWSGWYCKTCDIEFSRDSTCPLCLGEVVFKGGDERLLSFLWRNKHYSPFEFGGITVEVQAPIFVFREWHRHRTQSYNELSARYTELPDLFYVPSISRLMAGKQGQKNKQGSEDGLSIHDADDAREDIKHAFKMARSSYEQLLALGVSRELARMVIPVSQYSRMRASANLRNWLAFCSLRMAPEAQWEIRQYANIVGDIIKNRFPKTWELYNEEQNGNT